MNGQEPLPQLVVRPVRPDDDQRLRRTFHRLSPETVYRRFLGPIHDPPAHTLRRLADVDHDDREALVALDGDEIIAVARWDRDALQNDEAEVALLVEDAWQRRGVGVVLIRMLADEAVRHHIAVLTATILSDNIPIRRLLASTFGRAATVHLDGPQTRLAFRVAV
jgi:GNAT superfamily N-acetyltransferase